MAETAFLADMALKLGVCDKKVLRYANDLLKQLITQKGLICPESCKASVCLELASQSFPNDVVSRESAIKISGCKKSVYINKYNVISKMLNLDKIYTVKELCVSLGISELEAIATGLYEKYKSSFGVAEDDGQHPMYPCAAVMAACKRNKVKINATKLIEKSRLKKAEFETLVLEMETLYPNEDKTKGKRKKGPTIIVHGENVKPIKKAKKKSEDELESDYQAWKKRMLEEH